MEQKMKVIFIDKNRFQLSASELKIIIKNTDLPLPTVEGITKEINSKIILRNTIFHSIVFLVELAMFSFVFFFSELANGFWGFSISLLSFSVIDIFISKITENKRNLVVPFIENIETTYNLKFKQEDDII